MNIPTPKEYRKYWDEHRFRTVAGQAYQLKGLLCNALINGTQYVNYDLTTHRVEVLALLHNDFAAAGWSLHYEQGTVWCREATK